METLQKQNNTPHDHGITPDYSSIPNDNSTPDQVRSNERNALIAATNKTKP